MIAKQPLPARTATATACHNDFLKELDNIDDVMKDKWQ